LARVRHCKTCIQIRQAKVGRCRQGLSKKSLFECATQNMCYARDEKTFYKRQRSVLAMTVVSAVAIAVAGSLFVISLQQGTPDTSTFTWTTMTISTQGGGNRTVVVTETATLDLARIPFKHPVYLSNEVGECTHNGMDVPCFLDLSTAHVFNCPDAANPDGCAAVVRNATAPADNYTVSVWYPKTDQAGEPSDDNCEWSVTAGPQPFFSYCITVGPSEFIISNDGPGSY
jgi:hypothetical protein